MDTVNADRHSYNVNPAVLRPENCPTSFPGSLLTRPPLPVSCFEGRVGQETWIEVANCLFSLSQSCSNICPSFLLFFFLFFLIARRKVIVPLKKETGVIKKVSQKVGSSWRKLARELKLKEGTINNISEEEKESDDEERCYVTLQTWCKREGESATVRKLMIALTRIGKAEVNNDIMEYLDLLTPD